MLFPKGALYLIVCKSNEWALRIENTEKQNNSKVNAAQPNPQDLTQLFLIEQI